MNDTIQTSATAVGDKPPWSTATQGTTESAVGAAQTETLIFKRDTSTGEIVSIETIDANDRRTALPDERVRELVGSEECDEIDAALDNAFDCGVAVLTDESTDGDGSPGWDEQRHAMARALVLALAGRRVFRRMARARKGLLDRLIFRQLIRRYALRHNANTVKS